MAAMMAYPELGESHQILGTEYCSGYTDITGNWNNGFYCPQPENVTNIVACCGTSIYKYCCTKRNNVTTIPSGTTETYLPEPVTINVPINIFESPILILTIGTIIVLCLVLVIFLYCHYSRCCFYWRKQWNQSLQLEEAGGPAYNIYSIPSSDFTPYLQGTFTLPPSQVINNNNNINPRFNSNAFTSPESSLYSYGYCYNDLPPNYSSLTDSQVQNNRNSTIGQTSVYYSTSSDSIPLTLSDSGVGNSNSSGTSSGNSSSSTTAILRNPNRPLTLVNIRNNIAYITSAVPLTDLLKNELQPTTINPNDGNITSTRLKNYLTPNLNPSDSSNLSGSENDHNT